MSIEVNFTSDSKRENSTKQRTYGNPQNCVLKNGCSMLNPTLLLELDSETFPSYTGLSFGSRKYNILDVRSVRNNLFEIDGRVDVLETYKSTILGSTQFVAYSASNYNKYLTDRRVGISGQKTKSLTYLQTDYEIFSDTGCYILGVIDNDASGLTGPITYYALDQTALENIMAEINGTNFIETFIDNVRYTFSNPMEGIVSAVWVPIDPSKIIGTANQSISLINTQVTSATGLKITTPRVQTIYETIAHVPNDNYLDLSPFTTHSVYLPFVGNVPLDLDAIYPTPPRIRCEVDVLTGSVAYAIQTALDGGAFASTYSGNCGVKVPINNQTIDTTGVFGGILGTIGGIAAAIFAPSGALIATSLTGATASAAGAVKSAELHSQTNGAISSRVGAFVGLTPIQTTIVSPPSEAFGNSAASRGLPLFQRISLANLTGFVQTQGASIDGAMTSEERRELNTLLDTGIFIE